ncbi:hypothetical protein AC1031_000949 [Aphanomyces cochlioides]|nr:hypothetical protein AC1031_000949 [Aphanomyces cochlioides]
MEKEPEASPHVEKKPTMALMSIADDILLLNEVILTRPWESRRTAARTAWESIATSLSREDGLTSKKSGPALRKRFNFLVKKHALNEQASLRKSGSSEEYDVRDQLLTDISSRMSDFEQTEDVRLDLENRKKQGLINSGEVIRQLAMQSMKQTIDGDSLKTNKKKQKSKREALDMLFKGVSEGVSNLSKADEELATIQRERLLFDREQAELAKEQMRFAREQAIFAEKRHEESQLL